MLKPEQAQKQLKTFHIKNWDKDRFAAVGRLPQKAQAVGRLLFDRDAAGKPIRTWQQRQKVQEQATKALEGMSGKERQQLFGAMFPKRAKHLEAAWNLVPRLPYEINYDRKGFRAPGDPSVYREARMDWLQQVFSNLRGYDPDVAWCAAWAPYLDY